MKIVFILKKIHENLPKRKNVIIFPKTGQNCSSWEVKRNENIPSTL